MNDFPNTALIKHNNIKKEDLHDRKHLNKHAVKTFAKNIKAAYFDTTPKQRPRTKAPYPFINSGPFITPNSFPSLLNNAHRTPFSSFPYPSFTHSTSNLPPTHSNHPRKQEFSPNNALQIPLPPYPPHTTSRSPASHQRKQESINLPQQLIELIQQIYGYM